MRFVSVPSFGDSFFIGHCCIVPFDSKRVSVPSFGDSFFIIRAAALISLFLCFRPLIRGFFFYRKGTENDSLQKNVVSVPSFGDSFFILSIR